MEEVREGQSSAGLNLCDCCAYALSRVSGEPPLFQGADFRKTDVTAARPTPIGPSDTRPPDAIRPHITPVPIAPAAPADRGLVP
jgi:hypothetical protein